MKIIMNNNQNGFFYSFLLGFILFHYPCVCVCVRMFLRVIISSFDCCLLYDIFCFFSVVCFSWRLLSINNRWSKKGEGKKQKKKTKLEENCTDDANFQSMSKNLWKTLNRFNDTITWLMWQHKSHLITMIWCRCELCIVFYSVVVVVITAMK